MNLELVTDEIDKHKTPKFFSAFMGQIDILDKTFLVFVSHIQPTGVLDGHEIYQIGNVSFVPIQVNECLFSEDFSSRY